MQNFLPVRIENMTFTGNEKGYLQFVNFDPYSIVPLVLSMKTINATNNNVYFKSFIQLLAGTLNIDNSTFTKTQSLGNGACVISDISYSVV